MNLWEPQRKLCDYESKRPKLLFLWRHSQKKQ